jgi:hypothetical protein
MYSHRHQLNGSKIDKIINETIEYMNNMFNTNKKMKMRLKEQSKILFFS